MDSFKEGMIKRIYCENFLTYNSMECYPCAKLNMIVGPNGTGKSSLVNAIVLGLGGKTDVIGRAKSLSAFVKRGCETAKIEIELYSQPKNYVIRHIFNLDNKSSWAINGEHVTKKQLETVIQKLNIQVGNLCQFLPQDKVQDFAKMDSKQLLENTLKTVGSQDIVDLHDSLKELRNKETNLDSTTKAMKNQLNAEKTKLSRLEAEVKAIKEREEVLNSAKMFEKRRAWLEFENVERQYKQVLEEKKKVIQIKNEAEKDLIPFERGIAKTQEEIKKFGKDISGEIRSCGVSKANLNRQLEVSASVENELRSIDLELQQRIDERKRREHKILNLQVEVTRLETLVDTAKENQLAQEIKAMIPNIAKKTTEVSNIQTRAEGIQENMAEVKRNISRTDGALERERSAANQKRQILQHRFRDVHRAYEWLEGNRDKFRCNIYGPIMLEINCGERGAKFAEFVIPHRDLVAFVCEDKDDMNNFMRTVRDNMGLRINVVQAPPNFHLPVHENFPPRQSIQSLKQFGFWSYVLDQIDGPTPVLNYLCHSYRLHTIPIGDSKTNAMSDRIPNNINSYFSDSQHFSVRISKYSNEKSSRIVPVRDSFLLSGSVNTHQIDELNDSKKREEQKLKGMVTALEQAREQLVNAERERNDLLSHKRNADQELMNLRQGRSKLAMRKEELEVLVAAATFDPDAEKELARRKKSKLILNVCKSQLELKKCLADYQKSLGKQVLSQLKLKSAQHILSQKQRDCMELSRKVDDCKRMLNNVEEDVRRAKHNLQKTRDKALQLTEGLGPDDAEFKKRYKEKFDQMPADLDELDGEISSLTARADCLGGGRTAVLEEYEKTQRAISRLEKEVASPQQRLDLIKEEMAEKRGRWMPLVLGLVDRINANFTRFFSTMQCVGEVSLEQPDDQDDYSKYGICIKVQFRESGTLQRLGPYTQSGGERAVSTAVYMLSLQELTTVPFRCVDEINQGMDEFNERIVFKLMVRTVEQSNSAQCFLLTPKMLHLLEYSEFVRVHCIYSGAMALSHLQFNVNKYLEHIGKCGDGGNRRSSLKRKHYESDSD